MSEERPPYGVPDDENPEWTADQMRTVKPFATVFPDLALTERLKEKVVVRTRAETVGNRTELVVDFHDGTRLDVWVAHGGAVVVTLQDKTGRQAASTHSRG